MVIIVMFDREQEYRNTTYIKNGHLPNGLFHILELYIYDVIANFKIYTKSNYQYKHQYLIIDFEKIYTQTHKIFQIDTLLDDCFWCNENLKNDWILCIENINLDFYTLSIHFKYEKDNIAFKLARQ